MASVPSSTSSICGISIGTENCYVAVARQGGIEILLNEYSQRSTPAYIGFGGSQREIGVAAKQKHLMNLSNTCFAPTTIIGKKFHQLNLEEIPYRVEKGPQDEVLIRCTHNNEELLLTPVQIVAMLFTKLRQISGNPVDCVINCPNYFDFIQRKAMLDAAQIAGLNPLRCISDMTAVALYYGFYRTSPNNSEISIAGFVDCGQTSSQAALVLFNHKENFLKILDAEFLSNVGGKHFDEVLANYFIQKHNLKLNQRSRYRLIAECEKLKKNLSANPNELPINIECLYDEKDFSSKIDRATFEEIASDLFNQIGNMLELTFKRGLERYQNEHQEKHGDFRLEAVEIVGGTSRIPAIKRMIKKYSGMEPSTTLNADEAVARGCALQCAILSPTFKVARELQLIDSLPFAVDFKYQIPDNQMKTITSMYYRGHQFPFSKQITLNTHALPINVNFEYDSLTNEKILLSSYQICEPANVNFQQIVAQYKSPVKIRVRLDANCQLTISAATVSYEDHQTIETDEANDNNNQMETDQAANPQQSQEQTKRKRPKTQTIDLQINRLYLNGDIPQQLKDKFIETESNFILADKNWKEKTDARNALEEFIYEWRDRLESGDYDPFINPVEKQEFQKKLDENEKWLFEQDEQELMHSKSVYDERTESMAKTYANGILNRKRDFENRPRYLEQLGHQLQQARKLVEYQEPEEEEEIKKFFNEIEECQKWFDDVSGKLASMSTFDDPPFTCGDINKQINDLQASIQRIQNNRKRRADERRKAAEKNAEKQKQQEQQQQQQQQQASQPSPQGGEQQQGPTKMDVDPENPQQQQQA